MKRDMDLVRKILLELEEKEDPVQPLQDLEIPGYSPAQISHHIELMAQADLITAHDFSTMNSYEWCPTNLTWQGHEFLDTARNETIWNKAKGRLTEVTGGWSLELLKAYLLFEGKRQLGIEP